MILIVMLVMSLVEIWLWREEWEESGAKQRWEEAGAHPHAFRRTLGRANVVIDEWPI